MVMLTLVLIAATINVWGLWGKIKAGSVHPNNLTPKDYFANLFAVVWFSAVAGMQLCMILIESMLVTS